jgi:hypothetical protein
MNVKSPFSSPVKEYSLESYILDEEGKEVLDKKESWKYNSNGQISEINQYDPATKFSESSSYTYDKEQRLKEVIIKIEDGEVKKHLIYQYKDNALEQTIEAAGDYKIVTKFDDQGSPSEKQIFVGANTLISTTMYVSLYDDNGRLVETHTIYPSGDSEINKFQYNDAGWLVGEQKTRNKLVSTVKHSYNDRGDLILSDFNSGEPNHEMIKKDIAYNQNGDVSEIKEYRKGWCYQDHNDEYGLTGIFKYSYVR